MTALHLLAQFKTSNGSKYQFQDLMFTFVQGDTVGRVKERMQERLGVNDKVLLSESSRKSTDLMFYNFKGVGQVQSGFCAAREASLCGGRRQSDQHQGLHRYLIEHNCSPDI